METFIGLCLAAIVVLVIMTNLTPTSTLDEIKQRLTYKAGTFLTKDGELYKVHRYGGEHGLCHYKKTDGIINAEVHDYITTIKDLSGFKEVSIRHLNKVIQTLVDVVFEKETYIINFTDGTQECVNRELENGYNHFYQELVIRDSGFVTNLKTGISYNNNLVKSIEKLSVNETRQIEKPKYIYSLEII
jgi:hypothetical protein